MSGPDPRMIGAKGSANLGRVNFNRPISPKRQTITIHKALDIR